MIERLKELKFEECNTDEEIVDFWNRLYLLDGIKNDFKKKCVAKAMHNMARKLLTKDKYANNNELCIDHTIVIFPIIRRVIMDPYYKEINDFDTDFFENIINNSSIKEIINGIGDDFRKEVLSTKGFSKRLDEYENLIGNKTFHDIKYEDFVEIGTQLEVDAEAELLTILCDYYVQKIKEKNEREKEERTKMAQES